MQRVGLVYKTAVSQTGCDAVVADSLTTAKVRRAADYGKPIVSVADFSDWVLANQPDHSEFLSALFETPPEQSKTLVPLAAVLGLARRARDLLQAVNRVLEAAPERLPAPVVLA